MAEYKIRSTLEAFGIRKRLIDGKETWTLTVEDGDLSTLQTASWDDRTRTWVTRNEKAIESTRPLGSARQRSKAESLYGPDWAEYLPQSEHTNFLTRYDWASSPLGPMQSWSQALRLHLYTLLSNCQPAAIYWGPSHIAIYNEALLSVVGAKHPSLLGQSFEQVLPEMWHLVGPLFVELEETGMGLMRKALEIPVMRDSYLEETYWDGGFTPLRDSDGSNGGLLSSWVEVTRTVLQDRRTDLLNRLSRITDLTTEFFWQDIINALATSPRDVPMAMLYVAEECIADRSDERTSVLHLKHSIGCDRVDKTTISTLKTASSNDNQKLSHLIKRAMDSADEYLLINTSEIVAGSNIFDEIDWQGHGEPSSTIAVIALSAQGITKGFAILGLNPRRRLDPDHCQFVTDLTRQLKTLVTKSVTEEQAHVREASLRQQLSAREKRIARIVELAPAGIYDLAADGRLLWANEHFWDMMGVPKAQREPSLFAWQDYIHEDDIARISAQVMEILTNGIETSDVLRLRRKWHPPNADPDSEAESHPFWLLYSQSPDLAEDGSVLSMMGCLTDVSHVKWAEEIQAQNAELARQEKRKQEDFIDVTSHEMRNPLSAITQCADDIIFTLNDLGGQLDNAAEEAISSSIHAAESILFCAAHQKRIIEDVLTLSKLGSDLLKITPVLFYPKTLLSETIRMFQAEFVKDQILLTSSMEHVPSGLTVLGDSARIMQVLVNLVSNAIKFTKTASVRKIHLRLGISQQKPAADLFGPDFAWYSAKSSSSSSSNLEGSETDSEQSQYPYLYCAVSDTGKGIAASNTGKLFRKFEQADRRTYTEYGGSGLGLFISRKLTEMQGGSIGVSSTEHVGSTFAFYTKIQFTGQLDHSITAVGENETFPRQSAGTDVGVSLKQLRPDNVDFKVLLVEDNVLNQKILARQLEKSGCTVSVANHGGEAVDFISRQLGLSAPFNTAPPAETPPSHFDVVLMDWEMPVCSGLMATKMIREIEVRHSCQPNKIIGITANARNEQISLATEAGMDRVLPKPFRIAELLAVVGDLVTVRS